MGKLDDITTTAMVKTALLAREGLGAVHINVDTIGGVVHLRGWVRTEAERALAEEIAEIYEGVVVENELEVRPKG
jgi:osmotically-inducible protein OsmY